MLLQGMPGWALCEDVWTKRPENLVQVAARALRMIHDAGIVHGDACLPNILAEPKDGKVTGILDWGDALKTATVEMDLAQVLWSCGYNGLSDEHSCQLLADYGWKGTRVCRS